MKKINLLSFFDNKRWYVIPLIWSIISLFSGYNFIKHHYNDCLTNTYDQYGKYYNVAENVQYIAAVIAYLIAVVIIFYFSKFVLNAIRSNGNERKIIFFTIPVFVFLLYKLILEIKANGVTTLYRGDEVVIWDTAAKLYPFAFVYTSEIFLITFFIFPKIYAPSLIKIIICSLIIGYTINRCKKNYNSNLVYLFYLLLILAYHPIIDTCLRVHRMHWYGWLYLFFCIKIFFDSIERNNTKKLQEIIFMCILCSLLSCLRREGLYLLFLGLFLIVYIYGIPKKHINNKRNCLIISIFVITQLVAFIPPLSHNLFGEKVTSYNAFIVHMLGAKLDRNKSLDDLKVIEKKLDIAIVDKYNKELGYTAFADCLYSWPWWQNGKYFAIKEDNTVSSDEYFNAIISVIKQQPVIYLKSRIKAFKAVNILHPKDKLYVATFALLFIFFYSIKKRNMVLFVLTLGISIHTILTILTMPASYIKYFYEMILFVLFFFVIILNEFFKNKNLKLVKAD